MESIKDFLTEKCKRKMMSEKTANETVALLEKLSVETVDDLLQYTENDLIGFGLLEPIAKLIFRNGREKEQQNVAEETPKVATPGEEEKDKADNLLPTNQEVDEVPLPIQPPSFEREYVDTSTSSKKS